MPHARTLAFVLATGIAMGSFVPVARADEPTETIDPDYAVYLPPSSLETLNPWADRFDVDVRRKTPSDTVRSLHLRITITADGQPIVLREDTRPLNSGVRADFQEASLVPFGPVVRHGHLASLLPKWQVDGFDTRIELREDGPDGRVVYASRDPNKTITVSWPGVFERHGWVVTLVALLLGLALAARAARKTPDPAARRRVLLFDLAGLALLPVLPVAFGRYGVLLAIPLAAILATVPRAFKDRWASDLPAGGPGRTRLVLFSPALMAAALCGLWLLWHFTLIRAFNFATADFGEVLLPLAALYFAIALLVSIAVHRSACKARRRGRPPRAMWIVVMSSILLSAILRRLDWAVFFHSSAHADEEFWYHAFYRQNASMFDSGEGAWFFGTLAGELLLVGLLLWMAQRFAARVVAAGATPAPAVNADAPRPAPRGLAALLLLNAVIAFVVVTAGHRAALALGQPDSRDVSGSIFEAFGGVPEFKMLEPLARALFRSPPEPPTLPDPAWRERLEKAFGIRLQACSDQYPLVKPSLYLDPSHRNPDLERLPPNTNVIVLLAESLSANLLDDEALGVPGLTRNFHDFRANSLDLPRLWSSEFPTLRGETADLSSFMFGRGGNVTAGDIGKVARADFLFLSDVLKVERNYATAHVQSDYGTFAGAAGVFLKHHYDTVLTAEDEEILAYAKNGMVKTWGVYDEDLFGAVVGMLDQGTLPQPFFLSIATTDTHFPYATLHHHPATGGNALLDSIYSADVAFGVFWNWFKTSPYADNTLLVVTADHALVTRVLRRGDDARKLSQFDFLSGMYHLPGRSRLNGTRIDTPVSQLDLAPSVLDLLGIDVENPYLGQSIFSGRDRYPMLPSGELMTDRLTEREQDAIAAAGWTADDQSQLLDFLTGLGLANRIRSQAPICGGTPAATPADPAAPATPAAP